jgi:hypothetical protein
MQVLTTARSPHRCARALHRWALVALGRPADVSEAEADELMGSHRESRKLAKALAAVRVKLSTSNDLLSPLVATNHL